MLTTPRDLIKEEILANTPSADAGKLKEPQGPFELGCLKGYNECKRKNLINSHWIITWKELMVVLKRAPSGPATSTEYQQWNALERAKEHNDDKSRR